ncbi:hypothetical protein [Solitalea koreensis]|nr:hypothetical protein [Solitalea koreensis]
MKKYTPYATILYRNDSVVLEAFNLIYSTNKPRKSADRSGSYNPMFDIELTGIWDKLNAEKDAIDKLEIESKTAIQHFKQNFQDLNSFGDTITPLKAIIILLMIMFPITVIYPLHFMPVGANENPTITFNFITILSSFISLKSILLLAFFISIEGIFVTFSY